MSIQVILLPLFVEIALTFFLLYRTAFARNADFKSGLVHPRDIALGQLAWTPKTQQFSNSYGNQFELPVLFYVLTVLSLVTQHADMTFVVLAWIFVIARLAHCYIHVTSNRVMRRGMIFGIGGFALTLMWLIFAVRLLAGI